MEMHLAINGEQVVPANLFINLFLSGFHYPESRSPLCICWTKRLLLTVRLPTLVLVNEKSPDALDKEMQQLIFVIFCQSTEVMLLNFYENNKDSRFIMEIIKCSALIGGSIMSRIIILQH
jgi:hypothetical protein